MPFVVPQQQPERQKRTDGLGSMDHREYAPQPQRQTQQYGPAYRPPQQQQQRGGGYDPWQQQRQMQYRQPQQRQQYQPAPQPYRDPYGQRGGGRQYQQPQPMPYNTRQQRGYEQGRQEPVYSNRPERGNYVGEGVYADGTPMPSSGYNGQSLIQSNGGPAGGVYAGFGQTPDVIGGVTPRAYMEEDEAYNKPMRVGRGGGGIY